MVGRKCSREVNNLFGTEHHIEKNKYIETISIDNVHIFSNDFVFTKHFWYLLQLTIFAFDFLLTFWRKKNICLNILFVFHCPFLLPFCSRTSLGSSFGVKSINSRNFIHAKICPLKQRNTWTILYLIWETISLLKTNWQRRCFEAQ